MTADSVAFAPTGAIPINPEAERAVIAALMRDPDGRKILDLGITAELFAMDATREAFDAIRALILDDIQPDAATLRGAICNAALIEVETSLREHAGAANLPAYVRLLKDRRRERQVHAARARLMKAAAAGATPGELAAILETISMAEKDVVARGLRVCNVERMRTVELPSPRFLIDPLIPRDQVTLFGGHGGGGKTSVGNVICAHVATGTDWAGLRVLPGKVLLVSFEDQEELMLWRFKNIAEEYGLNIDKVIGNMRMLDATEALPMMQEVSERGIRSVRPTQVGSDLAAMMAGDRFDLVLIDNASDAFDGDENNRRQVRTFVRYLAGAIRVHHGALLLLAHIDKSAARYGSAGNSYSGSTAWHNSVRSRLALVDGELRQEKLNVGKKMEAGIRFCWSACGVPTPDDGAGAAAARNLIDHLDDAALLACFRAAEEAGATVPTGERGSSTTWHALSAYAECPKALREGKDRFRQGIARLARAGKIVRETYRDGRRHAAERYVLPDARVARVCASFETGAEVAHPDHPPPYARLISHRGVGESARTSKDDPELAHDPELARPDDPELAQPGNGGDADPAAQQAMTADPGAAGDADARARLETHR